jgi:hypothetical protein
LGQRSLNRGATARQRQRARAYKTRHPRCARFLLTHHSEAGEHPAEARSRLPEDAKRTLGAILKELREIDTLIVDKTLANAR